MWEENNDPAKETEKYQPEHWRKSKDVTELEVK